VGQNNFQYRSSLLDVLNLGSAAIVLVQFVINLWMLLDTASAYTVAFHTTPDLQSTLYVGSEI